LEDKGLREDDIKMDLTGERWQSVDWIGSGWESMAEFVNRIISFWLQ
jgi:hypothetical protein